MGVPSPRCKRTIGVALWEIPPRYDIMSLPKVLVPHSIRLKRCALYTLLAGPCQYHEAHTMKLIVTGRRSAPSRVPKGAIISSLIPSCDR